MKNVVVFLLCISVLLFVCFPADGATFFSEDFEGGVFPAGWTIQNLDVETWQMSNGRVDWDMAVNYGCSTCWQDEWLITPALDCSTYSNVKLSVWTEYNDFDGNDSASIYVSNDNGGNWNHTVVSWTTDERGIRVWDISSAAAGHSQVKIAFRYVGQYGYYWFIDNVALHSGNEPVLCVFETASDYANRDALMAALDANGLKYDIINRDDESSNSLQGLNFWESIVWAEQEWPIGHPDGDEQTSMVSFLDSGTEGAEKSLFLIGPDISEIIHGTVLHDQYLHAEILNDTTGATVMEPEVYLPSALLWEDFDENGILPSGWTIESYGIGNNWSVALESGTDYKMQVTYGNGAQDEWLISPVIDCSSETEVLLTYEHYYSDYDSGDFAYVDISLDGGISYIANVVTYSANNRGFESFDISSWVAGKSNVRIRFRYVGNNDWFWYLDEVHVGRPDPVAGLEDINISAVYVDHVQPHPSYPGAVMAMRQGSHEDFMKAGMLRYNGCGDTHYNTTFISTCKWSNLGTSQQRADMMKRVIENFDCSSTVTNLKINEIHIDTVNGLEIYNADSIPVDLSGWTIEWTDTAPDSGSFVLPAFTLNPGAYVEILEGSGSNDGDTIFAGSLINWTDTNGGSCGLLEPGTTGVDFVRWGGSVVNPPAGTAWFESTTPQTPSSGNNLGRDDAGTDTDHGDDWCIILPSMTAANLSDPDADGHHSCHDNCPEISNPGQEDLDLDRLGDVCDTDADGDSVDDSSDCDSADGNVWAIPSEVTGLELSGKDPVTFIWNAPAQAGCTAPIYDLLRSASASDWSGAVCVESNDSSDTTASETPPAGYFFYLVRVKNTCGDNMYEDSNSVERTGAVCP